MTHGFPPIDEIDLRWTLRDIQARRFTLAPVRPEELQRLIALGLVEICDDIPQLTGAGVVKIEL